MPDPPVKHNRLLQDGVVGDTGPVFRETRNGLILHLQSDKRPFRFPHIVAALINVPLWHSKHSAVTNVHLACKVCVQERLHFLSESSWNTPAALSANKSPNLTGKRRCLLSES